MSADNPFADDAVTAATHQSAFGNNAYGDTDAETDTLWGNADDDGIGVNMDVRAREAAEAAAERGVSSSSSKASISEKDLDLREENLRRKERELVERRERLERVEKEMNAENVREDNWPCVRYPVTYHSITQEIPAYARSHMRRMYTLVLCTFVILFWNFVAQMSLYMVDAQSSEDLLWSAIFFGIGIFGAWKLWYRQIYYGIRDRKTMKWWIFFGVFAFHCLFCIVFTLAPDKWPDGACGLWLLPDVFKKSAIAGILALVASLLWLLLSIASCFYLTQSWRLYRTRGGIEQATAEIRRETASQAVQHLV